MKQYSDLSDMHEHIFNCNFDSTLISYYENSGYYKSHKDTAVVTALTWFFKEPKMFEGGDLIFTKTEEEIKVSNNTVIIFPSHFAHEVTAIKMDGEPFSGNVRYCMSQFISMK
jgi:predicted 2-oxoglutarate/Fe(II)-dependent dioxygenase YbiX